jgi:hypothetical protein
MPTYGGGPGRLEQMTAPDSLAVILFFLSLKTISAIASSSAYSRIAFEGPCGSASISTRRSRSLSSAACFSSSVPAQAEELTLERPGSIAGTLTAVFGAKPSRASSSPRPVSEGRASQPPRPLCLSFPPRRNCRSLPRHSRTQGTQGKSCPIAMGKWTPEIHPLTRRRPPASVPLLPHGRPLPRKPCLRRESLAPGARFRAGR